MSRGDDFRVSRSERADVCFTVIGFHPTPSGDYSGTSESLGGRLNFPKEESQSDFIVPQEGKKDGKKGGSHGDERDRGEERDPVASTPERGFIEAAGISNCRLINAPRSFPCRLEISPSPLGKPARVNSLRVERCGWPSVEKKKTPEVKRACVNTYQVFLLSLYISSLVSLCLRIRSFSALLPPSSVFRILRPSVRTFVAL